MYFSILLYSTLFYPTPPDSTLHYSILLYSILFHPILFYSTVPYYILLCPTLILLYSLLL
jgi:hypothetical protein